MTVGTTAGDELAQIKKIWRLCDTTGWYIGFLKLELENNGKSLVGEFHSNSDDEIIDHFELTKIS